MAFCSHSLLLFLLLLPTTISSQPNTNITRGTTFSPSNLQSWLSPSGDFAFGFRPLETNSSLFLLAVWFNKISNKTVVWTANRDTPVDNKSKAELRLDGSFSLKDSAGQEIWNAGDGVTATYGSMLDTGNFILSSADSTIIWESFQNPTDTILPDQALNQGTTVYSRLMDDDYTTGRFGLTLQEDGNLVMYAVSFPTKFTHDPYFATATSGNTGLELVFNGSTGGIYLSFPNSTTLSLMPAPSVTRDDYLRATLDPDGVFRQYSFSKRNLSTGSWTIVGSIGDNICNHNFVTGSGSCGFNSFCEPDTIGKSQCKCPPHYSFIDTTKKYKGCKPEFSAQICQLGGEAPFSFELLINVDWPLSDSEEFSPMSETECKDNCMKDCFCLVAIHRFDSNIGTCWKKKFPLTNGRLSVDVNRKAFIKYSALNNSMPIAPSAEKQSDVSERGGRDWKTWVFVVSSILGVSLFLLLVQTGVFCLSYTRSKRERSSSNSRSTVKGLPLCPFTYKELEEATKGFSEEIGRGAFGTVYKGALPSQPGTLIAVKKLEDNLLEEAEKDFANEVVAIGRTHHKNLVQLLGFCKEGVHRLMVFEFMSKGSLNKFLFGSNSPEWNQRVKIALGIARGLAYLHEECKTQIIHCDIKPQNILLDENLEARISDFGLAKLLRLDQTRTSTGIRGTIGYFAPEWFKNVAITAKVDVYSFGVMLLEIICCQRNFEWGLESQENATVIDRAKECYRNGRLDLLVEDDEEAKMDGMRLERFVMVGISCIQEESWLRPTMKTVVQMLEGSTAVPIPPNMYSIRSDN